jgi:hypothetical protein
MKTKISVFLILNFSFLVSFAQQTTINKKEEFNPSAHKVMIIPFENRLYMSEIDHNINAETKMSGKEIKFKFRDGIDEQLYKAFKSAKINAIDLLDDTVKYKKELQSIYQHLSYEYMRVPDQDHYKPPKKEKEEQKIKNGQLAVETDIDARFMNAMITDARLIPALYQKYKTDLYVFINELDIKATGSKDPGSLGQGSSSRKIAVHYTVYTYDAKEINSGVAETDFETSLNNPKKIVDKYFAQLASQIVQRTIKGLGEDQKSH